MALLVLAYPEVVTGDYERIQTFRKQHDGLYYHVVKPHFTLVFPVFDWQEEAFVAEIARQKQDFHPFEFCLRCATLNKDAFNDHYHTFLVPDEGYSRIVKLHDRLYAGKLFPQRALSVDFVPHIGVGNSTDPLDCLSMIEQWNREEFVMPGFVDALDIVRYENDTVQTIQRLPLGQ